MSFGISERQLEELRRTYRKGTRVRLVHMDDQQAPPAGTLGTVDMVDDIGSVHIHWDNGCGLAALMEEDIIELVGRQKEN